MEEKTFWIALQKGFEEDFGPLPKLAQQKIANVINTQSNLKKDGFLVPINLGSGGPGGGGPAGGGSSAGSRSSNNRDIVNDSIPPIVRPNEGDDPGGPPRGGGNPGEGDDP